MPAQPVLGANNNQFLAMRLPRSLSAIETWGFGLSGLLLWLGTGPGMHAALGPQAIFVWLPSAIVGMLLNLQVKRLAINWPDMSGGSANYTTQLLKNYPELGRLAAIGYFLGWSSVPAMNAIILTDLIKADLNLGISCPETMLRIGFTGLPFILAFSGTRALGILHLCFVIPAMGLLLAFCLQGLGWLAVSPASPGIIPTSWFSFSFPDWAKWYFIAVYAIYDCETATSFVAESKQPANTWRCLPIAAWLIPFVYLGGSLILMQLATQSGLGDNTFLNLNAAAQPFWGQSASWLVTLLLVCSCLLSSATAVSNCPRILYQLALDGYLAPVFAVVSRRGVLEPALTFNLLIAFAYLMWGDLAQILTVTGTGYLSFSILFHFGLWLCRGRLEVKWPWWSLGFCVVEVVVLVVGGLAWDWRDLLIGLFLMPGILVLDARLRRIAFGPFDQAWWIQRQAQSSKTTDFMMLQVVVLVLLICSAATVGWAARAWLDNLNSNKINTDLFVVLLVTLSFIGVAIACWTSLPQVAAIASAREHAESLFMTALDTVPDTILVLDENGAINQVNPAASALFELDRIELIGRHLNDFLSGLRGSPADWQSRSEQTLTQPHVEPLQKSASRSIIEVTLSQRSNRQLQEYIVILRDVTERKQQEESLRQSEATARLQATKLKQTLQDLQKTQAQLIQTEKMSSLGQLVAGVAHEINNPVNFIYGNLTYVGDYTQDLLSLIDLYQHCYPTANPQITDRMAEIDLDFLIEDLPKTLESMSVGAKRIREIVLTLRNFSRLDEAEMKLVNIHEGLDSTLLILQHRLKAKPEQPGIQIIKEYGDLPLIECYPGQLNQVFMNILSNAIDALAESIVLSHSSLVNQLKSLTTNKGQMTNDNPFIRICTQVIDGDWVRIKIQDNGLGMSEAVKSRLFDPFFTTKPVGEGTGLGLSISYQIVVDKHGGKLSCISQPGQGAEFWIEIPTRQSSNMSVVSSPGFS